MTGLAKATENASKTELDLVSRMAELFKSWDMSLEEKLANLNIFMRRQELSYLLANYEIFKMIQNVKGNIFYFGVYHGSGFMTFANLSAALEPYNHTRRVIGFDTFSGYPEISKEDRVPGKEFHTLVEGGFKSDSLNSLKELIGIYDGNRALSHVPKLDLVKGDIMKTLPQYIKDNQQTVVSLIIITINLYHPIKEIFNTLWPRLSKGGICIIHSLNEEVYPGATKAVFEVLGNVELRTFPFTPNLSYIVKE